MCLHCMAVSLSYAGDMGRKELNSRSYTWRLHMKDTTGIWRLPYMVSHELKGSIYAIVQMDNL